MRLRLTPPTPAARSLARAPGCFSAGRRRRRSARFTCWGSSGRRRTRRDRQAVAMLQKPSAQGRRLVAASRDAERCLCDGHGAVCAVRRPDVALTPNVSGRAALPAGTQAPDGTWHVRTRACHSSRTSKPAIRTSTISGSPPPAPPTRRWRWRPRSNRLRVPGRQRNSDAVVVTRCRTARLRAYCRRRPVHQRDL